MLTDNPWSWTYVRMKKKYAEKLWLIWEIIDGQWRSLEKVLTEIEFRNRNRNCLGIVVQLPLPDHLRDHYAEIVSAVAVHKDLDGLNGLMFGKAAVGVNYFLPATPRAVIEILDYYWYGQLQGKTISIIGQSNLVGKPLAVALMNRGATVSSFNIDSNTTYVKERCAHSDIIISATGHVHLIDEWFFDISVDLNKKVMIDVWRWSFEDKPAGDINRRYYEEKVQAITPVPWGVGPVTVACLFANSIALYTELRE